jgi:hypothetical protein
VEVPPPGNWSDPGYTGSGINVEMGGGWEAKVGPVTGTGGVVTVMNKPGNPPTQVKLDIRKNTGSALVSGTYSLTVACTGPGGPYTGPNPVSFVLPSQPGNTISVPVGDTCTLTEAVPTFGSWSPPVFSGSGVTVGNPSAWVGQVGPVTASGGVVTLTNNPKTVGRLVPFEIRKSTGAAIVPGTYSLTVACTGPGGPYTGTNPVLLTLPGSPSAIVNVPYGDTCTLTETVPTFGSWTPPSFTGVGIGVTNPMNWVGQVNAVTAAGGVVELYNRPKPATDCPDRTQTTIGCRLTVTMKRTKGPATYSVIPSQAATYPMSNVLPSTGAACVIAGNAMINQTTCWFNYSASSTVLTLSTASSSGPPPLANWSGDCTATNSATCTVPAVTLANPRSVVVTFP